MRGKVAISSAISSFARIMDVTIVTSKHYHVILVFLAFCHYFDKLYYNSFGEAVGFLPFWRGAKVPGGACPLVARSVRACEHV